MASNRESLQLMVTRAMMNDDDQDDDSADDNGDGAHREAAGDMLDLNSPYPWTAHTGHAAVHIHTEWSPQCQS